ncbi:MAG: Na+/H+ antiporter NhaA, partial [Chloroflexi bacterium]|nr:Na+/H+ antiporter NhaA [Chloroflexota bacterium]
MDQVRQLIAITHEYSILLILGVFAGLAVANLDHQLYEELVDYHLFGDQAKLFGHTITAHFLTNEIFMVFFFGIAAKEITVSLLPGGALNPVNKAVNPLLGTIGGVLGPAGLYLLLAFIFFGRGDDFAVVANGW